MLSVDVISSDSLDYFKIFLYEKKMPSHTHRELSQFFISVCHMLASQWLLYDHPSCSAPLLQGVGLMEPCSLGTVLLVIPTFLLMSR